MDLIEMFKGAVNSVEASIITDIIATDADITVSSGAVLPDAPNILVIGGDATDAETVKLVEKKGNTLTVERAFQGVAKEWEAGTLIARYFTEYDHAAFIQNIKELVKTLTAAVLAFSSHEKQAVMSEDGAHGIRYHQETLQVNYDDEWVDIGVSGGGNTAHLGVAFLSSAYLGG